MKKVILNIFFLVFLNFLSQAQLPIHDSIPLDRDTIIPQPQVTIPILSDTTQYNDTTIINTAKGKDTVVKKKVHSPRKATIRSLIIPGWGQVYNKKYWKVPLVYTAIGIPAYTYFYNKSWYNRVRYGLSLVVNEQTGDPEAMAKLHPDLRVLVEGKLLGSLTNYRNEFRKDMDYSILFTILMWGLNVVDATVDGHLKEFDVSDDLSLRIKPSMQNGFYMPAPGLSLVVTIK